MAAAKFQRPVLRGGLAGGAVLRAGGRHALGRGTRRRAALLGGEALRSVGCAGTGGAAVDFDAGPEDGCAVFAGRKGSVLSGWRKDQYDHGRFAGGAAGECDGGDGR